MQMKLALAVLLLATGPTAASAKTTRFWNLTDNTITTLQLAPAGTETYGPNQCLNDKDKTVEHDERLKILGVSSGNYDAHLTDAKGRMCTVKALAVKEGEVFSIEEKQLVDCKK